MPDLDWGRAVAMLCSASGLTQAELAKADGIAPSYLTALKAGRRTRGGRQAHPSIDTLLRLAKAGGVAASKLVGWAEGEV